MKTTLFAICVALAASLSGCGSEPDYDALDYSSDAETDVSFDEDAARADAQAEVESEGYDGDCTADCSGHEAGFDWAAEGHEDYGTSSSLSFDEGQEAYEAAVEERLEEKREEFEDEGADSDYAY